MGASVCSGVGVATEERRGEFCNIDSGSEIGLAVGLGRGDAAGVGDGDSLSCAAAVLTVFRLSGGDGCGVACGRLSWVGAAGGGGAAEFALMLPGAPGGELKVSHITPAAMVNRIPKLNPADRA